MVQSPRQSLYHNNKKPARFGQAGFVRASLPLACPVLRDCRVKLFTLTLLLFAIDNPYAGRLP
jgi:hypothetical protein